MANFLWFFPNFFFFEKLYRKMVFFYRKGSVLVLETSTDVSASFSALVNYCESIKFKGFDTPRHYWQMSSFDESKAGQLINARSTADKFIKHNQQFLSRIYPKGTRVNSSNYDPIPLWLAGCQMVALNYQAQDKPVAYNRALFRANGQCGYILKPEPLLRGRYIIEFITLQSV